MMPTSWYYVDGSERVGPISEEQFHELIKKKTLNEDSYVWKKGYENWVKLKDIEEFKKFAAIEEPPVVDKIPDIIDLPEMKKEIDWEKMNPDSRIFSIKVGVDRNSNEEVYGPYTLNLLKKLYDEKRINAKSLIFTPGMEDWIFVADLPIYERVFLEVPPVIEEEDIEKRKNFRRPFIARMFFHDESVVFEGVCRDISEGGMQIMVSDFPGKIGDEISMNVHPENTDHCFMAKGSIVRILEGNQGFSLKFNELNGGAEKAIKSYLNNN